MEGRVQPYRLPLTAYRLPLTAYRLPLTAYRLPLTGYAGGRDRARLAERRRWLDTRLERGRLLEQEALAEVGAHPEQQVERLGRLHPFGDDLLVQTVGDVVQRPHEYAAALVG